MSLLVRFAPRPHREHTMPTLVSDLCKRTHLVDDISLLRLSILRLYASSKSGPPSKKEVPPRVRAFVYIVTILRRRRTSKDKLTAVVLPKCVVVNNQINIFVSSLSHSLFKTWANPLYSYPPPPRTTPVRIITSITPPPLLPAVSTLSIPTLRSRSHPSPSPDRPALLIHTPGLLGPRDP